MNWEDYKDEFIFDGGWRDIYVLSATVQEWQQVIDFIRTSIYSYKCWVGGEESILQSSAAEIFDGPFESKPFVTMNIGLIKLNCHFFTSDEIEFDLDPREIGNEADATQVFDFMRQLSRLLNKEVILTSENAPEYPIFSLSAGSEHFRYIPFGPYL